MASPRGACLPGRFPDTIPPSTKGYQCCVSGAVASICIFKKLSVDFLRTEGGGCYSWLSWQVHGRIRRGDREKLTSSTPGGAASPQALPSGPVRTGGEGGGCLHKDPRVSLSMLSLYTLGGPPNLVHLVADTNCAPRWLGSDTASL